MPSDDVMLGELLCWEMDDADQGLQYKQYGYSAD